jgi:Membrane bound O-acyl transferase family
MWALAIAVFAWVKWLTWHRTPAADVPRWRHVGYLFAWPGLDARAFLTGTAARRPSLVEWAFAAGKTALGLSVLVQIVPQVPADRPYLLGWVGMVGLIFILHFGLFHLLSCAWRAAGVNAKPLMLWPIMSTSVSEFWGRRWNTAFRDLTHGSLFRPLAARFGPRRALVIGFLFSGLIHDLVISFPAGGGYGGPTLFFALQAVALFAERSRVGKRFGMGRGWRGWLFTAVTLVGPAVLLFHQPFVLRVAVPFLSDLGVLT